MNKVRSALSTMLLVLVAACAQNKDTTALQPGMVGAGPMGAGVDIRQCQVGQVYNQTYGCMNRGSCQVGSGSTVNTAQQYQQQQAGNVAPTQGTCVQGTVVTEEMKFGLTAQIRHFGTLTIVNKAQFNVLMQYAGICNPYYYGFTVGMNGFSSVTCNSYTDRGAFIIVKAFGGASGQDSINLQVGAGTTVPYDLINVLPYTVYGQQSYTNSYMYRSFSQQSRLYSINANNGISLSGVNYNGSDVGLVLQAPTGNLGLQTFDAQLMFQGIVVATVQLQKY
jgi:hypothetical protein